MNKKKLKIARQEATKFIERVLTFEDRITEDQCVGVLRYGRKLASPIALYGCTESGAVKRASMDLTRALADLRKTSI